MIGISTLNLLRRSEYPFTQSCPCARNRHTERLGEKARSQGSDGGTVLVSAVVPTYNNEKTVGACFDSLIRNRPDEVIVVDGGSTDGTLKIVSEYNPTTILSSGRGVGKAKEVGWRASKGDLLLFLDADAKIQENAIITLQTYLAPPRVAGVCSRVACANPRKLLARLRDFDFQLSYSRAFHGSSVIDCFSDPTICGLFKRECLEAAGGFDVRYRYAEDLKLLAQMRSLAYTVLMVYEPAVFHSHRETWHELYDQLYHHGEGRRMLVDDLGGELYPRRSLISVTGAYMKDSLRAGFDILLSYPFYRLFAEYAFRMGFRAGHRFIEQKKVGESVLQLR